jgi:hypothetical protein
MQRALASAGALFISCYRPRMDKMAVLLKHLAQAQRHVAQGAVLIAEQKQRIADMRRSGQDAAGSEALLNSLLESQQLHEDSAARIVREISGLKP